MGHIIGPFGIHGWIKILPYTESPHGLMQYSSWWLGRENSEWQEVRVVEGYSNGSVLTAKLKEYMDRTQSQRLTGMHVAIPRSQLPALPAEGESGYYWSDLIGTDVINLKNEKLGRIVGLFGTGANDVVRIQDINSKEEILVPFIEQVIIKVDLKLSRVIVDWDIDY